jgi:hypothetical protein
MNNAGKYFGVLLAALMLSAVLAMSFSTQAAEFTKEDVERFTQEFMTVVKEGEKWFHSSKLGKNAVSCDQCHPNGANTHPETYPKFQKQLGRVISLGEMVNWCLRNPLEGDLWPWTIPRWWPCWLTCTGNGVGWPSRRASTEPFFSNSSRASLKDFSLSGSEFLPGRMESFVIILPTVGIRMEDF